MKLKCCKNGQAVSDLTDQQGIERWITENTGKSGDLVATAPWQAIHVFILVPGVQGTQLGYMSDLLIL
jgi:hypothetical protein